MFAEATLSVLCPKPEAAAKVNSNLGSLVVPKLFA
tara:strand:+ start:104 stop:208 length:105 start_codon:yes stop_codon:yes gene_type:complete